MFEFVFLSIWKALINYKQNELERRREIILEKYNEAYKFYLGEIVKEIKNDLDEGNERIN